MTWLVLLACAPTPPTAPPPSEPAPAPAPAPLPDPVPVASPAPDPAEDVTATFLAWNARDDRKPPTSFPSGSVSRRGLARVRKGSGSFRARLPSGTPVLTPTVHRGVVLASGGFGSQEVFAFDARTGDPRWAITLSDDGPSTFACEDGTCLLNTESCTIFAIDAETGEHRWSKWLGDPLMSSPTVASGRVFSAYPASGQRPDPRATHVLAAFDLKTGDILWQRWIDADVTSAPVAEDGDLYVTTFAGTVLRLSQQDGTIRYARAARATSAPSVVGDEVFYSSRADGQMGGVAERVTVTTPQGATKSVGAAKAAAYLDPAVQAASADAAKGAQLDAGNGFGAAPAPAAAAITTVGQGTVSQLQRWQGSRVLVMSGQNVVTMGDELLGTDRTGAVLWRTRLRGDLRAGGSLGSAPSAAGGFVFVATVDGHVEMFDPADGRRVKRWEVGAPLRGQPVIEDGWMYVGTETGELVGIDTGDASLGGWSHWGRDAARSGVAG